MALNTMLLLPGLAAAQGETPRCPNAPFRAPSGNWVWVAYFYDYFGGNHYGVDYVDISQATISQASPYPEPRLPRPQPGVGDDDIALAAELQGYQFPENVTPVYAPVSGYLNNVGRYYGFPGSVIMTATLDNVWQGKVQTRNVRLWFTHMSNNAGTVSYVVRPTGPINEGDLIGYQGSGGTSPTHLHFGVYDISVPSPSQRDGVLSPTNYLNSYVDGAEVIALGIDDDAQNYPVVCKQTPVGAIESPAWNQNVSGSTNISGYALDRTNVTQTVGISGGIDQVKVFIGGYDPNSVPAPTQVGTLLSTVNVNQPRPDIASVYGAQVSNSGWSFAANLAPYSLSCSTIRSGLYMYAHQAATGQWQLMDVRFVNIQPSLPLCSFLPFIWRQ